MGFGTATSYVNSALLLNTVINTVIKHQAWQAIGFNGLYVFTFYFNAGKYLLAWVPVCFFSVANSLWSCHAVDSNGISKSTNRSETRVDLSRLFCHWIDLGLDSFLIAEVQRYRALEI